MPLVLSGALPSVAAPSAKVTASFAGGAGEMVAVNVTSWPKTDGVPDEWTAVVVAIGPLVETVTGWLFGLSAPVQVPCSGVTVYCQVPPGTAFSAQVSAEIVPPQSAPGVIAVVPTWA